MKKTKSLITSIAFALVVACVASCEDGEEKLNNDQAEAKINSGGNRETSNARISGNLPVDSKVGDPISLATARQWTFNYRMNHPDETLAHMFGSEIIQQILSQTGCIGIRIYYATNDAGEKQLLLVGVDVNGDDLLPAEGARTDGEGTLIADASFPCPSTCPSNGL